MTVSGNARSGVEPAPRGLDLVQDLLNTAPSGRSAPRPELLADGASATAWARTVLAARDARPGTIDDAGAAALRALRDALRATLHARDGGDGGPGEARAAVELRLDAGGAVTVAPATGVAAVHGLVLAEVLLAQARGDWARLKLCALEPCDVAFWDATRNRSGKYHGRRCANYVDVNNARARDRLA